MTDTSDWLRARPIMRRLLMPGILLRRAIYVRPMQKYQLALRARLLRRVIGGTVTFDLSEFRGKFDVGIRSDVTTRVMFEGAYEREYAKRCSEVIDRERDAIDVGANVGFYTVLMASCLGAGRRVLSLEPTPKAYELLRRNVEQNHMSQKVIACQIAATARDGEETINVCVDREEYSSAGPVIHHSAAGSVVQSLVVPAAMLDTLCAKYTLKPGFLKIDVEGYEYQVLLGASHILKEFRPTILIELYDDLLRACGSSTSEVIAWLRTMGYRIFSAEGSSYETGRSYEGYALAMPR